MSAFDLFDPRSYLLFIETAKRPKGKWRPGADTVNAQLVIEPFQEFMNKGPRSEPDPDLLMMDAAVADQLGAFLRLPTGDEVEAAGIDAGDLIFVQRNGASIEYRLVRPEPGQRIKT
jgi:hypothetical protein